LFEIERSLSEVKELGRTVADLRERANELEAAVWRAVREVKGEVKEEA
jgi:hypothetical protein